MEIIPYIIDNNTVTLNILDASVSDVVVGGMVIYNSSNTRYPIRSRSITVNLFYWAA
jgi:hypothetical protein